MVRLTDTEKESIRFHLGYVEGGPTSARTVLEFRMDNLRSHQHRVMVRADIQRCNYALARLGLDDQQTNVVSSTLTDGDITRSTVNYASEPMKRREKAYETACNILAIHLGVENLLAAGDRLWQYTLQETRLPKPPGPSDTVAIDRVTAKRRYV